jgi:N-acetylglucosamine-6-sulfatase
MKLTAGRLARPLRVDLHGGRHRLAAAAVSVLAGSAAAVLTGALPLGPAVGPSPARAATPQGLPNIVLIVTDDQRVHSINARLMPHVWSLLRRHGRDFVNTSAPTSLCSPSRATLLTGLYAHSTRVYSNGQAAGNWHTFHESGLERRTVAVALHDKGYHTGLVGKYLNGAKHFVHRGSIPPGWDRFISFATKVSYYDYQLNRGPARRHRASDYSTDVLAKDAARFVRSSPRDRPLFLYFATVGPHRPFTAAPRDVGRWQGRLPSYRPASLTAGMRDKPRWVRQYARMPQSRIDRDVSRSQDALMSIDDAVGRLAGALRATGRLHHTLFLYVSDNGLMLGEHHMQEWKDLPYRMSTEVPLLVRWDGHVAADSTDRRLATDVDLAATISRAAGLGMPTEGLDLLGGTRRSGFPLEGASWFHTDSLPKRPAYCGYRSHRWMFAQYASGFRELYDYRRDSQELRNLAHDRAHRSMVLSLRQRAMATCTPVPPGFHW